MKPLQLHRRRHVCSIRGCHNRNTYLITRTKEHISPIWICEDCIRAAASIIDGDRENEIETILSTEQNSPEDKESDEHITPSVKPTHTPNKGSKGKGE